MKKFISIIVTKLKHSEYKLDSQIPNSYLLYYLIRRFIMSIRGFIVFGKLLAFVERGTSIRSRRKINITGPCTVGCFCHIDALSTEGIQLGSNVSIGRYTTIECTGSLRSIGKGLLVGNNVGLGTHGFFGCSGGISIGDDTILGNFVSMHAENHNYSDRSIPIRLQGVNHKGISIGKNCWIGAKVTILDGAIIEDGCIIAAGSVVIAGVYGKNRIYAGVPAKYIKER